jgi:hypothetical protein
MGEVRGSNPTDSHKTFTYNQPMRGTRGSHGLGHMSSYHFPSTGHVSTHHSPTSTNENMPHHPPTTSPYRWYGPATSLHGLYGQVQSASKNFAYSAWQTDHDIFSIWTPFEKVNIPPESGRRDGRNGTIFVTF